MIRIAVVAALVLFAAGAARAACLYPRAPERLPDGKTATHDEMVAAQQAVKQFDQDITAYTACLTLEMTALENSGQYDAARLEELRAMQFKKNDAAVDEVTAVVGEFNEQLRIFKARDEKD